MSAPVVAERRGRVGILTLDRGRALNALNEEMFVALTGHLMAWRDDPAIGCVVLRSAEPRAFCAGGDIKAVRDRRGDDAFMDHIYRIEYELDLLIHTFPNPVVALINGITMGGGCGISLHAAFRIATPDLDLAMPETGIGFFPDVGGSVFLGRLPDGIGTYLGLTGARIGAGDARDLGLVQAVAAAEDRNDIIQRLADGEAPAHVVESLPQPADLPRRLADRDRIGRYFRGESALAIVRALEAADDFWACETAELLRSRCPFSLEVTSRLIARGAGPSLRDALALDYRIAQKFMLRNDYFEGVRAALVDRDGRPAWQPSRLEDVDIAEVEGCFAPQDRDLW